MPEMSGPELAGRTDILCPRLKHLFMSGYTADVMARRGILDEGILFIQKPFSMKDLAAGVRAAMGTDS
jgi:two-component system, cell cycle sensor histidine kinase and response regulator CckA